MIAKAQAKYLRISPFKVRPLLRLIKGVKVNKATLILSAINKKAAFYTNKVLKSAIANAKNKGYPEDSLFISKAIANPGPMLKRFRAASFGRATGLNKRMSHVLVELDTSQKNTQEVKGK